MNVAGASSRPRRNPKVARAHILSAAERLLVEGGPHAVQVRAVARAAGMTDAGVTHHFRDHAGLLTALLEHGAARLRAAVEQSVGQWRAGGPDLMQLVSSLSVVYAEGYPRLALQLHEAGWRDRGPPLLEPVVEALLKAYPAVPADSLRVALAALHQWLALEPLFGAEFRRSVGATDEAAVLRQRNWFVEALQQTLQRRSSDYEGVIITTDKLLDTEWLP